MKALERYIKKNKTQPYGSSGNSGELKGPKGPKMDDQYAADNEEPKVVDDAKSSDLTTPGDKSDAYESLPGYGAKKKKRSYLD